MAIEKTQKDEEKKENEIAQNPNYKMKLPFSVNRDAPAKTTTNTTVKEQKISLEEV